MSPRSKPVNRASLNFSMLNYGPVHTSPTGLRRLHPVTYPGRMLKSSSAPPAPFSAPIRPRLLPSFQTRWNTGLRGCGEDLLALDHEFRSHAGQIFSPAAACLFQAIPGIHRLGSLGWKPLFGLAQLVETPVIRCFISLLLAKGGAGGGLIGIFPLGSSIQMPRAQEAIQCKFAFARVQIRLLVFRCASRDLD